MAKTIAGYLTFNEGQPDNAALNLPSECLRTVESVGQSVLASGNRRPTPIG
ncbi:hypothetical protein RB6812 [Rhodopirellula baltica SH 1]|uniref:Uncharacterized protein n=1 Tax=Rhodopirellula baltica (strain DSM 10527 / NCIMB 13988 / SH1) TaxID=243090 RepID=Q7UPN9_RHOBA|nr:hypothetical protein RB6812 [Rhodopirellula baltica SH 1]